MKDSLFLCRRSKNTHIVPTLQRSFQKSFSTTNASKLLPGSFEELYAEKNNLIDEMQIPTNHIIWGRRGMGKTHLLNAFVEHVNKDPNISDIALYVSCDRMARETPRDTIRLNNEYDTIRHYANETFRNFMNSICAQLFDKFEDFLRLKKKVINYRTFGDFDNYVVNVGVKILELMDICEKGVPRTAYKIAMNANIGSEFKKSRVGLDAEFGVDNGGLGGKLKAFLGIGKGKNFQKRREEVEEIQYDKSLTSIQRLVSELIEIMNIDCLYICIDELWLIDEKTLTSFQPFFLDNIRKSLGVLPNLGVKIASIRETTNLNSKSDVRISYGMQARNDIIELAHLDPVQSKMSDIYDMFREMIAKRVNYHVNAENRKTGQPFSFEDSYDSEYIITTIFKEMRNFNCLVNMSHGIPRNFLNILHACLRKFNYNLSSNYLHSHLISDVVIETYINEHRSDLALVDENTVYSAITEYVKREKQFFFIVDNKTVKRLQAEINTLLYNEIIHRIPSSETPTSIMDRYKAYYVNLGMYFLYMKESMESKYYEMLGQFELKLPPDLKKSYNLYILKLEAVSSDLTSCPKCTTTFSSSHRVYIMHGMCPNCAELI